DAGADGDDVPLAVCAAAAAVRGDRAAAGAEAGLYDLRQRRPDGDDEEDARGAGAEHDELATAERTVGDQHGEERADGCRGVRGERERFFGEDDREDLRELRAGAAEGQRGGL